MQAQLRSGELCAARVLPGRAFAAWRAQCRPVRGRAPSRGHPAYAGFTLRGVAVPSRASSVLLCPCPATSSPPGAPSHRPALGWTPHIWAPCQNRASPGRRHCSLPCVAQPLPSQPGAPSAEQAESGSGAHSEQDFGRWGEAAPSPESLGFCPATPLQPGALRPSWLILGQIPPKWAPSQTRASPGGERLHPPLRLSASARRRPCRLALLQPHRLNLGRTPPEWAPCPTLASPCRTRASPCRLHLSSQGKAAPFPDCTFP